MTGFDRAGNPVTVLTYHMSELTGTICHKADSKTIVSGREEIPMDHSGLHIRILSPHGKLWHSKLIVPTEQIEIFVFLF